MTVGFYMTGFFIVYFGAWFSGYITGAIARFFKSSLF